MAFDDTDVAEAFTQLDPPPGGLAALRARLQQADVPHAQAHGRRRAAWFVTALATAAAAVAGVILAWPGGPRPPGLIEQATADHYPSLVSLGLAAPPSEPVTLLAPQDSALRLRRVPSHSNAVVFYLAHAPAPR